MSRRRAPLVAGLCFALGLLVPVAAPAASHPVPTTPTTIAVYAGVLRQINPQLPNWQSRDLARHLLQDAQRFHIDANMLAAIVTVESNWHTHALSNVGAIGLGQLMPGTAATLGVDPRDPAQNLTGAARYLRGLLQKFASSTNRYELTFAAYNAGPAAVVRYGGVPPFDETQRYVVKVLRAWHKLESAIRLPADLAQNSVDAHGPDVDYWLNNPGGSDVR